jgi:hypothetical protein
MPTKPKKATSRTNTKNIPKKTKELSARDQKRVKGGEGQKNYSASNFQFKVGGLPER